MPFEQIAELGHAVGRVYAEGWQSWSPAGDCRFGETLPRAPDALRQTMGWRPEKPAPAGVLQAEGILVVEAPGGHACAWFAADPAREVPSLRLERDVVSADGPVQALRAESLDAALAAVGERLRRGSTRAIGPGWCSWSAYFSHVTEGDVVENVAVAARLDLPIEFVQIDDGYASCVGDWLDVAPRFGSLRRAAERIRAAGKRPGIWTAPFLAGERSALAGEHPRWLGPHDAGWNWGQRLRPLDVTRPDVGEHLHDVFATFREWGFEYYKLDFLYAGALAGIDAYRRGLDLIRSAVGDDAVLVGCGAPLLPSIGLVDAMRIGPDVLPQAPDAPVDLAHLIRATKARQWMNGVLWLNDPDTLVARPAIAEREAWAAHLAAYGGLAFSSDPLGALDERGVDLTRRVLTARPARS